uniref:Putative secreted protein n=1 Tax=Ixodes ricinus TaxID=34613 RepID=A0A090X9G6_IXORI
MASSFIGLLVLCLCLVYDQVWCQDQGRRTADIVIVLKSEDGGLPRVGLRSRCSHHLECAQLYAVCSNLTHSCVCPRGIPEQWHLRATTYASLRPTVPPVRLGRGATYATRRPAGQRGHLQGDPSCGSGLHGGCVHLLRRVCR